MQKLTKQHVLLHLGLMICLTNYRDHNTSPALMLPLAFIRPYHKSQTDQRLLSEFYLANTSSGYCLLASPMRQLKSKLS